MRLDRIADFALLGAVLAILLLAVAVRFHRLDAQSLWHDEGNTVVQSTRSLTAIAEHAARDIHPPGYYWLMAGWRALTGETEFALRAFSALASIVTVAFTYGLAARLFGPVAALTAALLVALNSFSVYYAQEARMYALLALWGAASMWALVGLLKAPLKGPLRKNRLLIFYAVILALVNAAGLYTQYAFPFVMLAQGMIFLLWWVTLLRQSTAPLRQNSQLWRWLGVSVAVNLLTLLLFAPLLPTAWRQVSEWPSTGQTVGLIEALAQIVAYLAYGITVGRGVTIMVVFFLLFALLQLPAMQNQKMGVLRFLPVAWVVISVAVFLILDLYREANLKFLLPAQVGFALWMGQGVAVLWDLKPRRPGAVLLLVPKAAAALGMLAVVNLLVVGLDALYNDPAYQRDDYRDIVAAIDVDSRPGDAIILAAPNQQEVFAYYYDGATPVYPLPRGLGGDDGATLQEIRQIIADYDRIFAVFWSLGERDPNNVIENTLDGEAFEASSQWYGTVRLVRYATPVEFASAEAVAVDFGQTAEIAAEDPLIHLESVALSAGTLHPGDVLQVQLIWSAAQPLETRYKVFLQLLDADGFLVAQRDSEPVGGLAPTTTWESGQPVTDNHALIIPNDLTPSHYNLILGLYDAGDPARRLIVAAGDDYVILEEVNIIE